MADDIVGKPEPTASPPVPEQLAAQTMSYWDIQIKTIETLAEEAANEYVTKARVQRIAMLALAQLMAMTTVQKQMEEEIAAEQAKGSGLILPDTRLVVPS